MKRAFKKLAGVYLLAFIAIGATAQINQVNHEKAVIERQASGKVYICNGPKARKYHSHKNCRGLNRCSGTISATSESGAQAKGFTPCLICY